MLIGLAVAMSFVSTFSSVDRAAAAAPVTYYVDRVAGHNTASGTSPALAWNTLARVNRAKFQPGDQILFKRGDVWREQLTVNDSGTSAAPIKFGSYGVGGLPTISGAKCVSASCMNGANRWIQTGSAAPIYRSSVKWKAGVFIADGEPLRFVAWNSTNPAVIWARMTPGSYSFDYRNRIAYIRMADGSSPDAHVIEAGWKNNNNYTVGAHDIEFDGIALRAGSLACVLTYRAVGWTFDNMDVRFCGGRFKDEDPLHQFYLGNGFELSNGTNGVTIRNSIISDVFDSGISPQLYTNYGTVRNITIESTEIFNTPLKGIEIVVWSDNSTMSGITVKNSYIHDSGRGWSAAENPNGALGTGIYSTVGPGLQSTISGVVIQDSIIANNVLDGIAVGFDAGVTVIQRNLITGNDYGIAFYDSQVETSTGAIIVDNENTANRETGLCFYVPNSLTGLQSSGNSSSDYCPATLAQHVSLYQ